MQKDPVKLIQIFFCGLEKIFVNRDTSQARLV